MRNLGPLETLKAMHKAVCIAVDDKLAKYNRAKNNKEPREVIAELVDECFTVADLEDHLEAIIDNWPQLCAIWHKKGR